MNKLATVAKPGTIVSTIVDTSGLHPQAQTVTFTRSTLPPFFTTRVQYTTPENAELTHRLTVAFERACRPLNRYDSGIGWIA